MPVARSTLRIGASMMTGSRCSSAGAASAISRRSRMSSIGCFCAPRAAHLLRRRLGLVEDAREIEAARLPVVDERLRVEEVGLADQLVELAHAHRRHDLARLLRHQEEEVDGVLRRADEALAEHRVLRGDADRAGVQMALAHHDAADGDERRGGEAELVGAEQRADDDVAAGLQPAVDLQRRCASAGPARPGSAASRRAPSPTACRHASAR